MRWLKHFGDAWKNSLDVGQDVGDLADRLFEVCDVTPPRNHKKLYDYAEKFFVTVAKCLDRLRGRICVEAVCRDVTTFLDGVTNGYWKGHDPPYPTQFDRIQLNNIP